MWETPRRLDDGRFSPWSEEYRFAFKDLGQFRSWFNWPHERAKLAERGYLLSTYHVDDSAVVKSDCGAQVVFKPQAALLIERRHLTEAA